MSLDQKPAPDLTPKVPTSNPLSGYFRQPAIYITLPSGGKYWPAGSIDIPESGELPVYPISTKDEIMLRTPDALMNGQGVVDVIHSCIPNIKNAWHMPTVDIDYVLIAIRIASYGHSMEFSHTCGSCREEHNYAMDLRHLNSTIHMPDYDTPTEERGLRIRFHPADYRKMTELNQTNFEISKTGQQIEAEGISQEVRDTYVKTTMEKIVALGYGVVSDATTSIEIIETGDIIDNRKFIEEFYQQIDSKLFNAIQTALGDKAKEANIKPQKAQCQNCGADIEINILFDYASFFVVGS